MNGEPIKVEAYVHNTTTRPPLEAEQEGAAPAGQPPAQGCTGLDRLVEMLMASAQAEAEIAGRQIVAGRLLEAKYHLGQCDGIIYTTSRFLAASASREAEERKGE